jgi:hypothetical protein
MTVYDQRCKQNSFEKQCIGYYIAYYLRRNAVHKSVAVDGGSTNYFVLEGIYRDAQAGRATVSHVLTNHLEGIYLARDFPDGDVPFWRCTGGVLRASRGVFVDGAEDAVEDCRCWTAVIGANGFEPPWIQTNTPREHGIKLAMIKEASNVIFPMDSSKWGSPAVVKLVTLHEIADRGKRIMLVTCYPVQNKSEFDRTFVKRTECFLDAVRALTQSPIWPPDRLKVYTACIRGKIVEEIEETEWKSGVEFMDNLGKVYSETASLDQKGQIGLVIRFDLRGEPC